MKLQLTNKFLHRVRIHGGEFDSSARAMNRAGLGNQFQADLRKFRGSTIERKQMSTKTTFKRVALVAVAALGLGVLASAPSNAAPTIAYTTIGDSAAGQALVGGQAVLTITPDTATVSRVAVTGVGSVVTTTETGGVTKVGTSLVSWSDSVTTVAGTQAVTLTSDVAGVTTITVTPLGADGSPGTAVTKSVTWTSALAKNSVAKSLAYVQKYDAAITASTIEKADSSTANLTYTATIATTSPKATVWVKQFSSSDTTTVSTVAAGKGANITVSISGAGSVGLANNQATGSSVSFLGTSSTLDAANLVYVYSDGRSGPATITITSGTETFTKTVTFTGSTKSYALDSTNGLSKKFLGVAETATLTVNGIDSLGKSTGVAAGLTITSETTTVATVQEIGSGVYTLTGVGEGKARIKFVDAAAANTPLYVNITVTKKTAASAVLAFDAASYEAGAKVTWTVTAKDSAGNPIADGPRAIYSAVTTNLSVAVGTLPGTTLDFVDGVATDYFFAPAATGSLVITTSAGLAMDSAIAAQAAATAAGTTYTAAKTDTSVTIANPAGDAAIDAATEATDAANAATDAALAAADAADAATAAAEDASAAVAKLAKSVNTQLKALKKQITALTALVNRLLR